MILSENYHLVPASNMVPESVQLSRLKNVEAENSLEERKDQVLRQGSRRQENKGPLGASSCLNSEISGKLADISARGTEGDLNVNVQNKVLPKKDGNGQDMTLKDLYNDEVTFSDEDDDSDWDPVQKPTGNVGSSGTTSFIDVENTGKLSETCKKSSQHEDMTLQDLYNCEVSDEDDDSDWDPLPVPTAAVKWFCVNCTMVNFEDVVHCGICGEHRESEILMHGCFASPFFKGLGSEVPIEGILKDQFLQDLSSDSITAVGFDERMLLHSEVVIKPHPHPERPDRLRAIAASLATAGIFPGKCFKIPAREITREELKKVHSLENIEAVEYSSQIVASYFTSDTYANEHSALAARLAAGLCADLASTIVSGRVNNGFALVRPPGHHAGVSHAMGFCLHNNAAVAALAAQMAGAKRVLIVDWDVHHGNGTQEIFENNKSVLYISLHRHEGGKFYPGTGAASEVGTNGAEGYCVNVPWSRGGVGDNDYIFAFQQVVLPIASEYAPDFTIISAGFDAARGDPLGCCDVTPAGYAQMTEMLSTFAGGKLLVILEGGYNLRSISSSATEVIKVLLGARRVCKVDNVVPTKSGLRTVVEVLKIQKNFWPKLDSALSNLLSLWGVHLQEKRKKIIKRKRAFVPVWWKFGRKRFAYQVLTKNHRSKSKKW
ncbi:histone deacetylase 15 isoform X2 [Apium graveolens]|uniref:histone deacetylase 15 isoform X2 n=1 Tax=Apium graveolens TaxID=4045 RepID=UPI003D7A0C5B